MDEERRTYRLNRKWLAQPVATGILSFLFLIIICFYIVKQRFEIVRNEELRQTINTAETIKSRFQQVLQYSYSATEALTLTIGPDGQPRHFDSIASYLLRNNRYIDALELVQGGTISHIYPLRGNETAIGYNILEDSTRNKEALKAIEKRELYFAGPVALKQGGEAVIGRLPVYLNNKFWGFSAAIIHVSTLLEAAGIDSVGKTGYFFQLSKIDPNTGRKVSFLPPHHARKSRSAVVVNISSGDWELMVFPVDPNKPFESVLPISLFALLLSFLGGLFAGYRAKVWRREKKESQIRIQTIVDATPECIKLLRADLTAMEINRPGLNMLEADSFDQVKALPLVEVVAEPYKEETIRIVKNAFAGESGTMQFEMRTLKGNRRWCEILVVPFRNANGQVIAALGVTRDMTRWKAAEDNLKESLQKIRHLTNHLQSVREEERMRVAREIHESLGQELAVLKLNLSRLDNRINNENGIAAPELRQLLHTINNLVRSTRKISADLRPGLLDDLGIVAAIEWYCLEFGRTTGIKVAFAPFKDEEELPEKLNVGLFRLFQESMRNIVTQCEASSVTVSLTENDGHMVLLIEIDGRQLDLTQLKEKESLEIMSMKERAMMIGGSHRVFAAAGKGTVIEIVVPVSLEKAKK